MRAKNLDGQRIELDSQQVELVGRAWLATQLLRDGVEVAIPERDIGIDLIAYLHGRSGEEFLARPVQLKASRRFSFAFDRKYERFHDLLFAFVWYLDSPSGTHAAFLTKAEVIEVCTAMRWTDTASWRGDTRTARGKGTGGYRAGSQSAQLAALLEPHLMGPGKWKAKLLAAEGQSRV